MSKELLDVRILLGLRNGQNTNISRGTIRNADAVLLLLASAGGVARIGQLKATLRAWRPGKVYNYVFQAHTGRGEGYGFCGDTFEQSTVSVEHYPHRGRKDWAWHTSTRRTYYYRIARGIIAISLEGYKRLAELGMQSHQPE